MIIILGIFGVSAILILIGVKIIQNNRRGQDKDKYTYSRRWPDWAHALITPSIIASALLSIILLGCWGGSYTTNLDLVAHYNAVIAEYAGAVEIYHDVAIIDFESITDFRYQQFGKMVVDLRNRTAWYNKVISKKRMLKRNPLFNWFLFSVPKECKSIKLKNLLKM